jgi:hypothetical protein
MTNVSYERPIGRHVALEPVSRWMVALGLGGWPHDGFLRRVRCRGRARAPGEASRVCVDHRLHLLGSAFAEALWTMLNSNAGG